MFLIIFESTVPTEASSTEGTYYEKLQSIVKNYSGFISETPFSSVSHPVSGVLIANFEDEAAAHRWRKDTHS